MSVNDGGLGIDWSGHIKVYAAALYDDGYEGLPSHAFTSTGTGGVGVANAFGSVEDAKSLRIQFMFLPEMATQRCFQDPRIVGISLYYTHSDEQHSDLWYLGTVDFNRGFVKAITIDTTDSTSGNEPVYEWATCQTAGITMGSNSLESEILTAYNGTTSIIEYVEMPKTERFEDRNFYSPYNKTISMDYKAVCQAGRRTFVGNIRVWNGIEYEYYNDRMIVSPVNQLETLPYPANVLDFDVSDGDDIVALASHGDKVLQFKKRTLYILNIATGIASEFYIEGKHKYKGILHRNHFCEIDEGIFWYNNKGAWIYDGDEIKDIFVVDSEEGNQKRIKSDDWKLYTKKKSLCGYNPESREIIIVKNCQFESSSHGFDADGNPLGNSREGDFLVYSTEVNAWSQGAKKFYLRGTTAGSGTGTPVDSFTKFKTMSNIVNFGPDATFEYIAEGHPGMPPLNPAEERY